MRCQQSDSLSRCTCWHPNHPDTNRHLPRWKQLPDISSEFNPKRQVIHWDGASTFQLTGRSVRGRDQLLVPEELHSYDRLPTDLLQHMWTRNDLTVQKGRIPTSHRHAIRFGVKFHDCWNDHHILSNCTHHSMLSSHAMQKCLEITKTKKTSHAVTNWIAWVVLLDTPWLVVLRQFSILW